MATLVKGDYLIDGTGAPPIKKGAVLLDEGKIIDVGPVDAIAAPQDAAIINCRGDTLLPGFIDSHTHVTLGPRGMSGLIGQTGADQASMILRGVHNLRVDLLSGVTCSRSLGEPIPFIDLTLRDAVRNRLIPGPTLTTAGRALGPSHGAGGIVGCNCDGEDALRKAVRENVAAGVEWIKLMITNVRHGQTPDGARLGDLIPVAAYTRKEIEAAIDEAHNVGIKVAVHALGGPAMKWALECGVDSVEHANLATDKDIEHFLKAGAWISTPNLYLFFDPDSTFAEGPEWWRDRVEEARRRTADVLPRAIEAGVRIALGADTRHGELWREARALVHLGIDPLDSIVACTRAGAELCGCLDVRGTLSPGKVADIVSVQGNPTRDIDALGRVNLVMKQGIVYKHLECQTYVLSRSGS